jgi:hypothetical protein
MQLAVIKKDGEWSVLRDGQVVRSGASRSACIEAAEAMAFDAEVRGEAVELVVQDYLGHLKTRYSGAEPD